MKKILLSLFLGATIFANTPSVCNQMDDVIISASNRAFKEFDEGKHAYGCNDIKIAYRALKTKHYRDCDDVTDAELMLTYQQILEQRCGTHN
jgi:hypothetical protein